ncbi:hypothetical protein BJ973_003895 [Actinoplanes tereljensis]|uniref:Uncharacterized protein n=1 Tax=Paractinoplanes tereljensis TaxID=571912 RepID=A0A919NYE8_9ACTN|nr:hypothetical protein [Actinoplanes tereljensis]GIF25617.1 hypothetical protein Ate02nite_83470 [Actinoplanes tereljensis]
MGRAGSSDDNNSSNWTLERIMTEIYGFENGAAPSWGREQVAAKTWFKFDASWKDSDHFFHTADPSKYWKPVSVEHPDWYNLALGRLTTYSDYYGSTFTDVQGKLLFWDQADNAKALWDKFHDTITGLHGEISADGNSTLDATTFRTFGQLLFDVKKEIEKQGTSINSTISSMYGDYNGNRGSGTDAFIWRLHNLHGDMHDLHEDIAPASMARAGSAPTADNISLPDLFYSTIPSKIKGLSEAYADTVRDWFAKKIDPTELIKAVVSSIWMSNIWYLTIQKNTHVAHPAPFKYVLVDAEGVVFHPPVELETAADWSTLDQIVKERWKAQLQSVDAMLAPYATALVTTFNDVSDRLRHSITDFVDEPGNGTGEGNDPTGGNDFNPNDLFGDGSGSGGGGEDPFAGLPDASDGSGGSGDPFADLPDGSDAFGGADDPFGGLPDSSDAFNSSSDPFADLPAFSSSNSGSTDPFSGLPDLSTTGSSSAFDPAGLPSLSSLGGLGALGGLGGLSGLGGGSGGFGGLGAGSSKGGGGIGAFDGLAGADDSAYSPTGLDGAGLVPTSDFAAGSDLLGAAGAAGSAAGTSAGSSGMPMMPPMGGMGGMGGGKGKEDERERSTWLAEDEEIWGTDPDVSPAVVGREAVQPQQQQRPGAQPQQRPGSPYAPTTQPRQRGRA